MKRIVSILIVFNIIISLFPNIVFGATSSELGALESNPVVLTSENSAYEIEAEDFSWCTSGYEKKFDYSASGYYAISGAAGNTACPLWIKNENSGKVKVFARVKYVHSGATAPYNYSMTLKLNGEGVERSLYINSLNEYVWVCLDSFEVEKGATVSLDFFHTSARAYVDKFVITSDITKFPQGSTTVTYSDMYDFSYGTGKYDVPGITPRASRPRLLVNSDTLPAIRTKIADTTDSETQGVYASLLEKANIEVTDYSFGKSVSYIYSNAFLSVLSEDDTAKENYALKAINALKEANTVNSNMPLRTGTGKDGYNARDFRIYITAIVYDWCYDYLTDDDKKAFIYEMLFYMDQLEYSYPPIHVHGRNNGHESESDILVAMLSFALAIYEENDNSGYNNMFNIIYGKISSEMLDTRNYYYLMNNHTQGTHYNASRMSIESRFMALLNAAFGEGLIKDGADEILMEYIYGQRPDNSFMRNGDSDGEGLRNGPNAVAKPFFMYGNYYENPYIKNEYYRLKYGKNTFGYSLTGLTEVEWLMFNNPNVKRRDYRELPLTYYAGDNAGVMYARTSWEQGSGGYSDAMVVRMNLETIYGDGHDHMDAGHFDIYYKGSLALDSGGYGGISTDHYKNYYKKTIAHNSMLLYQPGEEISTSGRWNFNDGGQMHKTSNGVSYDEMVESQKIGEILAKDFYGEDMTNPSFSYMKGDLTKAYNSSKMQDYERSFVFLNFFDDIYPGALIVFDKMTSKNADYKKTWLLHTQEEPEIAGGTTIAKKLESDYKVGKNNYSADVSDNGRLINTTLLPKEDNRTIEKIGGAGNEFYVSSSDSGSGNFSDGANVEDHFPDYGQWRIELTPKTASATDCFLNVMHVTEADDSISILQPELIEAGDFYGAKIKDRVVFFNTADENENTSMTFTITGDENYEILVTGLEAGKWNITSSDSLSYETAAIATTNGYNLVFSGTAGTYTLTKDTGSSETLTRNLSYTEYIDDDNNTPYTYLSINGIYYDMDHFEENGKLYVSLSDFDRFMGTKWKVTDWGDTLNVSAPDYISAYPDYEDVFKIELSKENGEYKEVDGVKYIYINAVNDLFCVSYKKDALDYNVSFGVREISIITDAESFNNANFSNQKGLYIIDGKEQLNDKTLGINLNKISYSSKAKLEGVLKGVDGGNNIGLNTLLFKEAGTAYVKVSNVNFKGTGSDGTGTISSAEQNFGILFGRSRYSPDLRIEKVNNYLNMTSTSTSNVFAGTLIGRHYNGSKATFEKCTNYGDISFATGFAGGLVGQIYNDSTVLNISLCANYGNITSSSSGEDNNIGGIAGYCAGGTVDIKTSFNAGNITGSSYAGGLLGSSYTGTANVSNSFNAGNVTTKGYKPTSGIASRNKGTLTVSNCYNVGTVSAGSTTYKKPISNASVANITGCYYVGDSNSTTLESLSLSLPTEFLPKIWEYVANDEKQRYSLPQIIGNTFIYNSDDRFYFEKAPVSLSSVNYVILSTDFEEKEKVYDSVTGAEIKTAYAIVPAKFTCLTGVDTSKIEYGVLISQTQSGNLLTYENAKMIAKGARNKNGSYAILIYGKMEPNSIYYVRPYVKYNGKVYYSDASQFTAPEYYSGIDSWLNSKGFSEYSKTVTTFKIENEILEEVTE